MGKFARLAWSAAMMETSEAILWGTASAVTGLLPTGATGTAAYSIVFAVRPLPPFDALVHTSCPVLQ